MPLSSLSAQETARLDALRRYRVLDSAPERAYDDAVLLASTICETPIALVSLIDEHRQWFKARHGLEASETPREHAFCAHAIESTDTFIVADAARDARFAANPLVLGDPHIRFYAGAPLVDGDGYALGTLCVIDRVPRHLTNSQQQALEALSRQVVTQLQLRRTADELAAALEETRTLRALLPVCAWCRDVRDDAGYWSSLEQYLARHHGADYSHGICPTCYAKMLPASPCGEPA